MVQLMSERIGVSGSENAALELAWERGWTDGLPIVTPTEERTIAFLETLGLEPDQVIAQIPPRWADATVEKVVINSIMAGCRPEYVPVVIAAIEAIADQEFNLYGIQATTNPVAPMIVVNGPIASQLGFNSGPSALGQGTRANATVGRAVRLIMVNVGGGTPGDMDRATQGQPAKFTFCFAENEDESPWEPLHVERGFESTDSTVSVFSATGTTNLLDQGSVSARGLLMTYTSAMSIVGTNNVYLGGDPLFLVSPEHASTLAARGLSKSEIKKLLFEGGRVPEQAFSRQNIYILKARRPHLFEDDPKPAFIPVVDRPEDIQLVVVGGPGKHTTFVPTFGVSCGVTRRIRV